MRLGHLPYISTISPNPMRLPGSASLRTSYILTDRKSGFGRMFGEIIKILLGLPLLGCREMNSPKSPFTFCVYNLK